MLLEDGEEKIRVTCSLLSLRVRVHRVGSARRQFHFLLTMTLVDSQRRCRSRRRR